MLKKWFVPALLMVLFTLAGCGPRQEFKFMPDREDERLCQGEDMYATLSVNYEDPRDMSYDDETREFYAYRGGADKPMEFYFVVCNTIISDMRRVEGRFTPETDYFVTDFEGGYNALYIPVRDFEQREVYFEFLPDDEDRRLCGRGRMTVTLFIYDEARDSYEEYELLYNDGDETFSATIDVYGNVVEFYYTLCGQSMTDMSAWDGQFLPAAQYFVDDGQGGFNALYIAK